MFFFVGTALVGGFLFEKIIFHIPKKFWKLNFKDLWNDPVIKKLLLILPVLILVTFLNPNGIEGVLAPLKTHSYATFTVSENQPLFNLKASLFSWDIFSSAFVPMIAVFLFSFLFGFRNKPVFFLLAGFGSAGAALLQVRLATLFALIFLLAVSSNFNGIFLTIRNWFKQKLPKITVVLGYGLAVIIAAAYPYKIYDINVSATERGYKTDWGVGLDGQSNGAGEFFKNNNLKGPIFNDYDIGGYIIYHLFPDEKVFVDNNGADSYPVSFFDDVFMPVLHQEDKWKEVSEKYGINAIVISLRDGSPAVANFIWRRFRDNSWALVYADTYFIILLRNVSENQEIIKKFYITSKNANEKLKHLLESENVLDKIIGGRLLYLAGREDLSTSVLKKVVAQFPKNSWVWLYMGSIKSYQDDPANLISSVIFLENAVNLGEKTAEAYTWLGLAYFKTAQFEKAENAFQKALWLEPDRYDVTGYLKQLQQYLNVEK